MPPDDHSTEHQHRRRNDSFLTSVPRTSSSRTVDRMKSFTTFALALVVLAAVLQKSGAEHHVETGDHLELADGSDLEIPDAPFVEVRAGRHTRASCDLFSFQSKWATPNHSVCAAHCLTMGRGFKGGYCKDTICHCRK